MDSPSSPPRSKTTSTRKAPPLCLVAIGEVDFASGDVQTALNMVTQQLDYIANSNTPPRVSGKDQERLSWSIQPSSSTTIDKVGKWYDVADTRVNFSLQRTGLVVIHYNLVARASKPQHPGGDFLNGGGNRMSSNSDFLAGRLKVDAIPYRQSGSHVSPLSSLESSSRQLSGSLIIELGKGNHTVHLQWRKWGHVVTKWTTSVDQHGYDGLANSRSITVTSRQKYLWYHQQVFMSGRSALKETLQA